MTEPSPNTSPSNAQTILFMVILSFICAFILAVLASALAEPKDTAKDLDRSKQMMIAAKILSHEGYFLLENEQGEMVPAKLSSEGVLVPGSKEDMPTQAQLLEVYKKRFRPMLVDDKGETYTFEKKNIVEEDYITKHKKIGYYKQPLKLIYAIMPNQASETDAKPIGYVIPVNGMGLWDAIYGYLAIKTDGTTVIGISWYDQKETPGLGANIAEAYWQNFFPGKQIVQPPATGEANFKTAPLGITVVKGKVSDVLGDSPKSKSAVDGMAGATLTGNGVTDAYRDVLNAYRPFLIKVHEGKEKAS